MGNGGSSPIAAISQIPVIGAPVKFISAAVANPTGDNIGNAFLGSVTQGIVTTQGVNPFAAIDNSFVGQTLGLSPSAALEGGGMPGGDMMGAMNPLSFLGGGGAADPNATAAQVAPAPAVAAAKAPSAPAPATVKPALAKPPPSVPAGTAAPPVVATSQAAPLPPATAPSGGGDSVSSSSTYWLLGGGGASLSFLCSCSIVVAIIAFMVMSGRGGGGN
jgi:hypothetical protein